MSVSANSSAEPSVRRPHGEGPDWDKVPLDVGCARCGQDLRGLSDPVCPRCDLIFDWADAVPIEELTCWRCGYHLYGLSDTRCPECGERFTWEDALAAYHTRRQPLFEYQWRRRPLRSFIRTWTRALRPGRLWRNIDIHDRPRIGPLLVMACLAITLSASANATMFGVILWDLQRIPLFGAWLPTSADLWDLPGFILRAHVDAESYVMLPGIVVWCGFSCCALLIFRQSMRLYKVRTVHVVRVWAHAVPLMLPPAFVGFAVCVILAECVGLAGLDEALLVFVCAFLVHVVWSLRQGYRYYLHMPHALAVAIASQLVALLATFGAAVAPYLG